ncbi:MAG: D-3-phosphoglycerate dehydrogenase / 2-oxoglutarate reductase [Clostridia bacterium]|nr:D-3-phosphoglycerate dehydrogenase / 2-oxoglutarate reductase [Clostridia bacterium]
MRVLILDNVSQEGVELLRQSGVEVEVRAKMAKEELLEVVGGFEGLIVRSATKVTREVIEAGRRLKIIGRAGVGTDNIDVEAATERGIIVVNAPEGNTIAAAEHTIGMLLALARNIPQANQTLKQGRWEKNKFTGIELRGKTLGIIGLGKIGSEVAKRARAMGMEVRGYDPYISEEHAARLGVVLGSLEEVLSGADFLTLHVPLVPETRYIINSETIKIMKPGARLLNIARGGLVDEAALYQALKEGRLAGAALDVFEKEPITESPLFELETVIVTPHLGASTEEAQVAVAIEVAQDFIRYAQGQPVHNAVNIPVLREELAPVLKPYLDLAERLGKFLAQLLDGPVREIELRYTGELAQFDLSVVTNTFLKGFLKPLLPDTVNYVNAPVIARQRGIKVREYKSREMEYYTNLITVATNGPKPTSLAGTVTVSNEPRLVRLNGYAIDAVPQGHLLVVPHIDRPRIIGPVGLAIGAHGINIAAMQVGRQVIGGEAVMVLNIDEEVPPEVLNEIRQIDGVLDVHYVHI